jgi:FixJ family two-component response regulator
MIDDNKLIGGDIKMAVTEMEYGPMDWIQQ